MPSTSRSSASPPPSCRSSRTRFQGDIKRQWGDLPSALLDAYPHATDDQARQARAHFERDLRFGWDIWAWARLQAQTGRSPVFYYHFSHSPPFPAHSVYAGWGPSHYAELWYVFDHLDQEPWSWTATDRSLADVMSAYWTNFARTGDPNGAGLPSWPHFTLRRSQILRLGDPIAVAGVANLDTLKVFDGVYDQVRGSPSQSNDRNSGGHPAARAVAGQSKVESHSGRTRP